jgi:putative transposase
LATVVVDDGTILFYRGSIVKSDYFYFEKKIAELDKLKSETEKVQEQEAKDEVLRERERVTKLYRGLLHLQNFSLSPHQDFVESWRFNSVFGLS